MSDSKMFPLFLLFFITKNNRKHKSDNHIQFYSYFFMVIYDYYIFLNNY